MRREERDEAGKDGWMGGGKDEGWEERERGSGGAGEREEKWKCER